MTSPDFQGRDALIATIEAAIAGPDPAKVVARLSGDLQTLLHAGELRLPAHAFATVEGRHVRHLLHQSDEHGYSVIAMTWAPGQGTPLHDHDGQWCVEGIVDGALEIVEFDLLESLGNLHRFSECECVHEPQGSTAGLHPPREFHVVRNPSADTTAVSLHIYQRLMDRCRVFEPLPQRPGWHRAGQRELHFD